MTVSQVAQTPSDVPLSVRGGADVVVPASTSTPTSTAAPPSRGSITVTPGAVSAIRKQIQKRGRTDTALRVGIRGGGCSGFSYVIEFHDGAPRPKDVIFDYDDVRVLVDPKSLLYLQGLKWVNDLTGRSKKLPPEAIGRDERI